MPATRPHAQRTCSVWCPDWPVVAACRHDPVLAGAALAVRERVGHRDVVRAVSPVARADGVTRGMRRREAETRCPGIVLVDADPGLEARTFEVVARAVETLTPRVVLERPGVLAFPTRGPARGCGGDAGLAARVHEVVAGALGPGADVRVGIADGAFAAGLAARRADPGTHCIVAAGDAAAFLAPWPVATLGDPALADVLHRLGIRTLGDFAALPVASVTARFGAPARRLHRLACGDDDVPLVLVEPPPDLVESAELDPPATRVDVAAFAAKGLADRLLERLAARGLACTRAVVVAETEHGERLTRCWGHDGPFTAAALAERARWQLEGWLLARSSDSAVPAADPSDPRAQQDAAAFAESFDTATGALVLVRLVPDTVVPLGNHQIGFWGGDRAAGERSARVLARLQGMLGEHAVVTAVAQGGRTPSERVRWVPWGEPRAPERPLVVDGETVAWPGAVPVPSPALVYDPPLPAALVDGRGRPVTVSGRGEQSSVPARLQCAALPDGGGDISAWAGPWAYDVRWWDPGARRRRALWQVLVATGAGEVACLVSVRSGAAGVEAIYD